MIKKSVYITGAGIIEGGAEAGGGNCLTIQPEQYEPLLANRQLRNVDRISRLALAAAVLALEDRGLAIEKDKPNEYGLILGTKYGALESIHDFDTVSVQKGALMVNPGLFPNTVLNSPICQVGIQLSIAGPIYTVCNGITSGLDSIGIGYCLIMTGMASMVLSGAGDEVSKLSSTMNEGVLPVGEASGFLVMELLDDHRYSGINALAEVIGHETTSFNEDSTQNIAGQIVHSIEKMLHKHGLSINDIEGMYFNETGDKDFAGKVSAGLKYGRYVECLTADWMGVGGIVQVVSVIKSDKLEWDRSLHLFVNIGHDRVSILIIKK